MPGMYMQLFFRRNMAAYISYFYTQHLCILNIVTYMLVMYMRHPYTWNIAIYLPMVHIQLISHEVQLSIKSKIIQIGQEMKEI